MKAHLSATLVPTGVRCDECGGVFDIVAHPEPGHTESPGWSAHARLTRMVADAERYAEALADSHHVPTAELAEEFLAIIKGGLAESALPVTGATITDGILWTAGGW